uniref:Uncharacterized protein n=1 Tax=Acrobeloides nanus TaxID=290746 RepID=A0A914CMJ8_9BILA
MVRYFTDDSTSTESSDEEEFNIRTVEKIGRKRRIPTRSMNNSNTRLKVPKTKDDSKEPRRSPRRPGILREVANVSVSPPKKRPITQLEPIDPPNPYSANVVNDRFQRLMRDYTNLYFYLSMPDSTGFCKRPKYQPFMHRNLYYMKQRSLAVKREYNRSAVAKPRPSSVASCPKAKASSSKFCWEKSSQTSETTTGSTRTLTVKFSYIRHSDLPGHRTAKIQLFIATQTNGSYAKIEKLPSACFDMPMNEKLTVPISIDLPPTVSLDSNDDVEMKCHYLVTRVWFSSGQSSITSSGKSLRNVPSRKAMLCDKGKSLRSSPTKSSRLKQDEMLMFGAKQLTEITKETQDVLDGDGGIVFM